MRASVRIAAVVAAAAAVMVAVTLPAGAAGTNLVKDGGFERPKVVGSLSIVGGPNVFFGGKCIPGTAHNCWGIGAGTIDIVRNTVWDPRAGKQSADLNSGSKSASIAQSLFTSPGTTYKITFWLAATPGAPDNVNLGVFWGEINQHGETISTDEKDFNFFPIGHTSTNMGWTKETFLETTPTLGQQPDFAESRLYFQSKTNLGPTNEDYGPVIDAVSVKPI